MLRKADPTIPSRYLMGQRRNAIKCSKAGIPERYWFEKGNDPIFEKAFGIFSSDKWLVLLYDEGSQSRSNLLMTDLLKLHRIPCYVEFHEVVRMVSESGMGYIEKWLKIEYNALGLANVAQSKYMKNVSSDLVNMVSSVYNAKTVVKGVIALKKYDDMKSIYGAFIKYLTSEPIFEFLDL